jgi:uncharacterized protein with GYD domain
MPVYLLLSTLTPHGIECIIENPACLREISRDIEQLGVKVLDQYATLGQYDFVHVIEAPDNETVARVSMELNVRGHLKPSACRPFRSTTISRLSLDRRP